MSSAETPDYVAIERLQRRYADLVTRRMWPELAQLFETDCPIRLDLRGSQLEFVGGAAIAEFIDSAVERFDFFVFSILNSVIEDLDVAMGRATGRMYICELRHELAAGEFSQAFGVYRDEFRRRPDGWKFASRSYCTVGRHTPDRFVAFAMPRE
jgi:SnoaL-like domain